MTAASRPRPCDRGETGDGTPLVSVVIAVKDGERTILRAVASVLDQTYPNIEVVVVVNGTTDGTADILTTINDPRVRVINLPHPGRSRARNTGKDAANGEYVVFLDADDELLPSKVDNAWALLRDGFDAAQGATLYRHPNGRLTTILPHQGRNFIGRLHVRNTIPLNSMTVRREACRDFPEDSEYCEDWEFWLQTLPGLRIATYPSPDSVVHKHDGNTSADFVRMKSHEIPIYVHHHPPEIPLRWRLSRAYLIALALALYANEPPIPAVERAVKDSRPVEAAVWILRRLPWLSEFARQFLRLRVQISRSRPPRSGAQT